MSIMARLAAVHLAIRLFLPIPLNVPIPATSSSILTFLPCMMVGSLMKRYQIMNTSQVTIRTLTQTRHFLFRVSIHKARESVV